MSDQTISQLLTDCYNNKNPVVEPPGLPQFDPESQVSIGTLPLYLGHFFVAMQEIRVSELRNCPNPTLTEAACVAFVREVAGNFQLVIGDEFEICAGLTVAVTDNDPVTQGLQDVLEGRIDRVL